MVLLLNLKSTYVMKRIAYFLAATLLVAAASCSKEVTPVVDNDQPVVEDNQPVSTVKKISFTAYADNGDETRTSLNEDNSVTWAAGEAIYVFDGKAPRKFVSTNTEPAKVVTFEGEADAEATTYYAVSPAATMSGSTITATIPVFQTATAGTFDPKAAISVAVSGTDPNDPTALKFKNAAAAVKFQIRNNDVTKIRLEAINGEKLAGKATITLDSDNIPQIQMVGAESEPCVILQPENGGSFDVGQDYVIAVAPGTYSGGFRLTLFKADDTFVSIANTNPQDLGRSDIMNFGAMPVVPSDKWKLAGYDCLDEITRVTTGVTMNSTNYSSWQNKQCNSNAKYAGSSAGGNNSIQLRSTNSSGIVSTTSGGTIKSVSISWNSGTANERELQIYGKNTAYSSSADLYDDNKKGTLIGTFIKKTNAVTELSVDGSYQYIGIRSKSGALYLDKVSIVWYVRGDATAPVDPEVASPMFVVTGPESNTFGPAGGTSSFVVSANIPWTLSLDDETVASYSLETDGDDTTVSVSFGGITSGSRTANFTITPSQGDEETISYVQSCEPIYSELFTIQSDDVVGNSSYTSYSATVDNRGWVITFGGNQKSVGTNSGNRSKCNLSSDSKYAVDPITTSVVASAFANTTSIANVSKIKYTLDGGSNQTSSKVYLLYSNDNTTFSLMPLVSTSPAQGANISSGAEFAFDKRSGYFAVVFVATNSDGNWRLDDVNLTFYTNN